MKDAIAERTCTTGKEFWPLIYCILGAAGSEFSAFVVLL